MLFRWGGEALVPFISLNTIVFCMGHKGQVLAIQNNAHSLSWVEIGAMGLPFLESPSNSASPWCAPFFFELQQLLCNDFAQCGGGDSPPRGADQPDLLLQTNQMPHSDSLG